MHVYGEVHSIVLVLLLLLLLAVQAGTCFTASWHVLLRSRVHVIEEVICLCYEKLEMYGGTSDPPTRGQPLYKRHALYSYMVWIEITIITKATFHFLIPDSGQHLCTQLTQYNTKLQNCLFLRAKTRKPHPQLCLIIMVV